jgi:hypothetical protein
MADVPAPNLPSDYNAYLEPRRPPQPNHASGKGEIERPGGFPNMTWQTRSAPPTEYERQLGDALEQAFQNGAETLPELVAKLNETGMRSSDGTPWTEAAFAAEIARLAAT